MKKILVITPATHFKNIGAAQKDIYATIKMLKELGYEVVLYSIHTNAQSEDVILKNSKRLGIDYRLFLPTNTQSGWLKRLTINPTVFDGAAAVFSELVADPTFKKFISDFAPDLIFSFCSYSWPILKFAKEQGIKSVFRSHNFESSFFWESLLIKEKINPVNWIRFWAKYCGEYLAVHYANQIATLPFVEIVKYKQWKNTKIQVWTLAFLPESIRPTRQQLPKMPLDLFFLGASYNIIFHKRGAELLIQKIVPQVLAKAPGQFRFHVCGAKLPEYLVKQCNQDTIVYEGYVPDLEVFLAKMDAGVFPTMTGKTMKGKVFETLCRAFPLVIPTLGKGGYDLRNNQEVLVADSEAEFVEQILRLSDPELRQQLADGAAKFAETEFSEKVVKNKLVEVLDKALK